MFKFSSSYDLQSVMGGLYILYVEAAIINTLVYLEFYIILDFIYFFLFRTKSIHIRMCNELRYIGCIILN